MDEPTYPEPKKGELIEKISFDEESDIEFFKHGLFYIVRCHNSFHDYFIVYVSDNLKEASKAFREELEELLEYVVEEKEKEEAMKVLKKYKKMYR